MRGETSRYKQLCGTVVLAFVVCMTACMCAFGQTATGTITGTITDPKGLAMAGVNVTVHNVDTGADMRPVTTNDSGIYQVPLLPPGTYDVTAGQTGFATMQRKGLVVQVGSTVRIDIEMQVSAQQTLVTVTTEIPLLETEKTEHSQNVSENLVSELPVSSRRWEQFALLTPGVNLDGGAGGMSFHGVNSNYNNNSVDGANNSSSFNGGSRGGSGDGYTYSGDSIREFQVSSSGFGAEIGQAAGGAVNAVTKSGTNSLHGDLFYNGRAANFNALDPVAKQNAAANNQVASQTVHQQHQYGFSVGGPLVKDKLFFFATMDGYRKINPLITTTSQLTPSINALTCPTLSTTAVAGTTAPSPAQCQAAKDFVFARVVGTFSRYLRQDIEFLKLDYQLNQPNHLNVVTNFRDWKNPTDPTSVNGGTSYLQSRFVIGTWTSVISNNKVNEVRYQWGKDQSFSTLNFSASAPGANLSNLFSYGLTNGTTYTFEDRHQISDNFSFTRGAHSFKTGVDLNFIHNKVRSSGNSTGSYRYSSAVALGSNISCVAPSGFSSAQSNNTIFCDWLMDLYGKDAKETPLGTGGAGARFGKHWASFTQITDAHHAGPPETFIADFKFSDYAAYFQDTWKLRSNLTVNAGLRYDVQKFPAVTYPGTSSAVLVRYTTISPTDYGGIQPRLGIAWNFAKHSVLRFGGGIYYAKTIGSTWKTARAGTGEPQIQCTPTSTNPACSAVVNGVGLTFPNVLFNQQDAPLVAPFVIGSLPAAQQPLTPAVVQPTGNFCPCGNRGIDPDNRRPRTYQLEAAVEQQLPWNLNLSVSYIFTRGVHLPTVIDGNIAANFDPAYSRFVTKAYDVVNAAGVTERIESVRLYFRRIDPNTGPIIAQFSGVNSRYNGLVVTMRKPMSHGIEVLGNYTLSKSTDDGQAGVSIGGESNFNSDGILDPYDRRFEQGYSATDARHRMTTSVVWQPGFGKNLTGIARQVVSGWAMSTTILATNGNRHSGMVQSTASPSVVYTNPAGSATPTTTYTGLNGGMGGVDLGSTADAIPGKISWVPRNFYKLPNLYNVDLRLTKQFIINERMNVEVRGEAFNLFNRTLVQAVNQSAYTYAAPGTAGCPASHANTCMIPVSAFQTVTSTSGNLLGARQMQAGVRFNF